MPQPDDATTLHAAEAIAFTLSYFEHTPFIAKDPNSSFPILLHFNSCRASAPARFATQFLSTSFSFGRKPTVGYPPGGNSVHTRRDCSADQLDAASTDAQSARLAADAASTVSEEEEEGAASADANASADADAAPSSASAFNDASVDLDGHAISLHVNYNEQHSLEWGGVGCRGRRRRRPTFGSYSAPHTHHTAASDFYFLLLYLLLFHLVYFLSRIGFYFRLDLRRIPASPLDGKCSDFECYKQQQQQQRQQQ